MENNAIILFPNTTATEYYHSSTGRFLGWDVTADPGYVLHEITHDTELPDEYGNPTGEVILGYTRATIFVGWNYDFESNPRQIYAKLESEIEDPDQIHGDDEPDHEVASTEPDAEPEPITE
jgi:hypothetical protein